MVTIPSIENSFPFSMGASVCRWHHVTGAPIGTCSRTPSRTSLSKPALTSSCQCNGTGMGVSIMRVLAGIEGAGAGVVGIKEVLFEFRLCCGDRWRLCPFWAVTVLLGCVRGVSLTGSRCLIDRRELVWDDP